MPECRPYDIELFKVDQSELLLALLNAVCEPTLYVIGATYGMNVCCRNVHRLNDCFLNVHLSLLYHDGASNAALRSECTCTCTYCLFGRLDGPFFSLCVPPTFLTLSGTSRQNWGLPMRFERTIHESPREVLSDKSWALKFMFCMRSTVSKIFWDQLAYDSSACYDHLKI